jgi:mannose/fructose/N-acetylgalactosamine-specific phosphotransferase system component IID
MKSNIKLALDKWILGAGPFSFHPMDMNRFYNIIHECIKEDYILTHEDIADAMKEHLKFIDSEIQKESIKFEEKAEAVSGFVDFLKNEKDIDINSML